MGNPLEKTKLVNAISPVTLFTSAVGNYISLKNTNDAYIVIQINKTNTEVAPIIYPTQATAVAGTAVKVFSTSHSFNIWASNAVSSDDTLTKQTAASNFTLGATTGKQMCIFHIPAGEMDLANGFDCLGVQVLATTSSDFVSATYVLDLRYAEYDPPTVLTD